MKLFILAQTNLFNQPNSLFSALTADYAEGFTAFRELGANDTEWASNYIGIISAISESCIYQKIKLTLDFAFCMFMSFVKLHLFKLFIINVIFVLCTF